MGRETLFIRTVAACTLRQAARSMFDDVDLDLRDAPWVDTDSYDAGLIASAKFLLARADRLESGELEEE